MPNQAVNRPLIALAVTAMVAGQPAIAGTYVVENFAAPAIVNTYAHVGDGVVVDTTEAVPNPRRLYAVAFDGGQPFVNTVTSGGGALTFSSTGNAAAGVQFSVGVPGGTVDTTPYNYVHLHFLRLAEGLNLNAEFFTAYSPTGYYIDSAANSGAPANGGPFDVYIPINFQPGFDATAVNAFYLGIEGAGRGPGEQFALGGYSLTTSVPEPATWALLIAGFAAVGGVARRRRVAVVAA
ncbi:PEPxxWA-CTERM sorting domain-containing protein [Sphingomonas bacterium]|uniref:PEPxxWA-CTERM sorting domain-containing protein n=1 Tax=Sphingomonas bacterium TaxID=1895847 RepID=UPI00157707BC|nr:PEPxxWA-CTERM sorting domain-containing protein [Sphingomonas bacterium]